LIGNNSSQRKIIEKLSEILPDIGIAVFSVALIVETIDLSDLSAFMVSSEKSDSVLISNFQSQEKSDGFNTMVTSVNVITHKQVVGILEIT